jgi:hypothetical protein
VDPEEKPVFKPLELTPPRVESQEEPTEYDNVVAAKTATEPAPIGVPTVEFSLAGDKDELAVEQPTQKRSTASIGELRHKMSTMSFREEV